MRRTPQNQSNSPVRREHDVRALSRLFCLLVCGMVLASGFVFAAQQHFAAVRLGYSSEELRREHDRLMEEQRRLLLMREEASTPSRLEAAARQLGLQPLQAAQIEIKRPSTSEDRPPVTAQKPAVTHSPGKH